MRVVVLSCAETEMGDEVLVVAIMDLRSDPVSWRGR